MTINSNSFIKKNNDFLLSNGDVISLLTSFLFFFIQPYYVILIFACLQLFIRINPLFFFPLFCFSTALYWSKRNIGIEWDTGFDDAVYYIDSFKAMQFESLNSLLKIYISEPFAGHDIFYNYIVYIISLFTSDERVFLFFIYFLMLSLISIASYSFSKKKYIILITLIFFGLGSFVEQSALHLFRATISSLFLFVGILRYENNPKSSLILILSSPLFHIAITPFVMLFFIINFFKNSLNSFYIILSSLTLIILIKLFSDNFLSIIYNLNRLVYVDSSYEFQSESLTLLMLIILVLFIGNIDKNYILKYSFFIIVLLFLIFLILPEYTFISGRYLAMLLVFNSLLLFHCISFINNKILKSLILIFLFSRKMIVLSNSEFIYEAFNDFSKFYSPHFFI